MARMTTTARARKKKAQQKAADHSRGCGRDPLAIVAFIWWFATRNEITTDDAYTDGNAITMAPKVSGYVVQLAVNDNVYVHKRRSARRDRQARLPGEGGSGAGASRASRTRN